MPRPVQQIWALPIVFQADQLRRLQAEAAAVGEACTVRYVTAWVQTVVDLQLLELANSDLAGEPNQLARDWYEEVYSEPGMEAG